MYPVSRRSQRLELRELTPDDTNAVFAIYGNPEATEHLSFEARSRQDVGHIVARSIASATAAPRAEYCLAVIERDSSDLIGYGRLATDPHQQRAATLGFALRPESWGIGYGVETIQLLLALAFDGLDLHRVWGARSPLNAASARTMLKAGMIEEGRIRGHILKAGQWRDSIVHAILADEWTDHGSREGL
ncbi:GNAT family N-acetyltransferase [Streptomyces albireticuli]|uniref:GNAT family N-acetyltransferase n=1 Tax=Streptomyces albireticuli TaxID=1940 RepID=A0A2A2D647_9ACTN|nr:GNAT family protein [Streptomyces albireticuli]MCD9165770.1 GNAT family N-acetyltransferase [Streptomyces albireticuli]MCD9195988.1 GNAT family N-acetyltransferase [Streptomyces albireticuli]PAU46916.1 GNAT family N-acetyltransferase [Streptomyces albireticuli]